jgi:short-subunit dehydrogenase
MEKIPSLEREKRVIITGGTEGIGRVITEEMLQQGNEVAVCARTEEKIDELKNTHNEINAYCVDLSDRHSATDFVEKSIADLGGVDVLILNAALDITRPEVKNEKGEIIEKAVTEEDVFKVNEVANVAISRSAQKTLAENGGTIVFMTSGTAHLADIPTAEAYQKSKREIEEWLSGFSERPGNENIKIFSVNPGSVDTRMHHNILESEDGPLKDRTKDLIKTGNLRDKNIIGKIVSKMSLTGKKFNPETGKYDQEIKNCEVVRITDENIKFESEKK